MAIEEETDTSIRVTCAGALPKRTKDGLSFMQRTRLIYDYREQERNQERDYSGRGSGKYAIVKRAGLYSLAEVERVNMLTVIVTRLSSASPCKHLADAKTEFKDMLSEQRFSI